MTLEEAETLDKHAYPAENFSLANRHMLVCEFKKKDSEAFGASWFLKVLWLSTEDPEKMRNIVLHVHLSRNPETEAIGLPDWDVPMNVRWHLRDLEGEGAHGVRPPLWMRLRVMDYLTSLIGVRNSEWNAYLMNTYAQFQPPLPSDEF
jgi:hypothetical protein